MYKVNFGIMVFLVSLLAILFSALIVELSVGLSQDFLYAAITFFCIVSLPTWFVGVVSFLIDNK